MNFKCQITTKLFQHGYNNNWNRGKWDGNTSEFSRLQSRQNIYQLFWIVVNESGNEIRVSRDFLEFFFKSQSESSSLSVFLRKIQCIDLFSSPSPSLHSKRKPKSVNTICCVNPTKRSCGKKCLSSRDWSRLVNCMRLHQFQGLFCSFRVSISRRLSRSIIKWFPLRIKTCNQVRKCLQINSYRPCIHQNFMILLTLSIKKLKKLVNFWLRG